MKKVSIVVNKNWEVEPVLASMCSYEFRPSGLPFPEVLQSNKDKGYRVDNIDMPTFNEKSARAVFRFYEKTLNANNPEVTMEVMVWCIQDFMKPNENPSSSEEKNRFLPALLSAADANLVIAVGTAGYLADVSYAGCVVVGGRFFVHDGHPSEDENPASRMRSEKFDKILPVTFNEEIFGLIDGDFKRKVESRFLKVPINPCVRTACLASKFYTAVGTVNVTDYSEYAWKDHETIDALRRIDKNLPIGSMETTHGIIRINSGAPTIFVSAITDREGHFDLEVTPGQNYVASFNAGIVLSHLIVSLHQFTLQGKKFSV